MALQSQASSLNVALRVSYDSRQTRDASGNVTTDFYVKGGEAFGQVEDLQAVADKITAAMQPADAARIEAWLAELSVITARRQGDEFSETLRIEAYAARLKAYPADVVKTALLGRTWRFWPTWAELGDVCDTLYQTRRVLLSMTHSALSRPKQERLAQAEPSAQDPAEIKAAAERIMEQSGFTPRRMEAVRNSPLARSMDEAEHRLERDRVPHWSETATPDDPRWEMLRRSRIASGMIKPQEAAE